MRGPTQVANGGRPEVRFGHGDVDGQGVTGVKKYELGWEAVTRTIQSRSTKSRMLSGSRQWVVVVVEVVATRGKKC